MDYTKDIRFWKRLKSFVSDVQVNDAMGEEEKEMILHICKMKISDIPVVIESLPTDTMIKCPNCGDGFSINECDIID